MSQKIVVRGFIRYGKWTPLLKDERRVSELDMSRSNAGYRFLTGNKINPTAAFGGFCNATFGTGGSRNKLIRFDKGVGVYNFVIDGSMYADVRVELNKKRKEIMGNVSMIRPDAMQLILIACLNDYNPSTRQIQTELRAENGVIADVIGALNKAGFNAHATDKDWNRVTVQPFSSVTVEPTKDKEIVRDRGFFIIEPDVNAAFTVAKHTMDFKGTAKVMLTGPSGFGKTTAAKKLAEKLGYKFVKVDCSTLVEPTDIVHTAAFRGGETVFDKTEFIRAIEDGKAVILLDELNRAYPNVLNTLLPVLDDTRSLTVGTETYKVANNVIFVATANIGQQYVGTFQSDSALLNRFSNTARVGELSGEQEAEIVYHHTNLKMEQAAAVVGILRELRKTLTNTVLDFSPRTAEAIGLAMNAGLEMHNAVRVVLHAVSLPEEWKVVVDTLNSHGYKYGKTGKLLF